MRPSVVILTFMVPVTDQVRGSARDYAIATLRDRIKNGEQVEPTETVELNEIYFKEDGTCRSCGYFHSQCVCTGR